MLAHAAQAAVAVLCVRLAHPAAVVGHAQDDAACARLERELDAAGLCVAGDVREALLGDPVDRQLGVRREARQIRREVALDRDPALVGEPARELRERADQAEVLEQLRPQLLRDPPHLLERLPHRLLRLGDAAAAALRIGVVERVELEQHAGQHLADLVVQPARDAQPLRLLRCERAAAAVAALALESVEHLVEGVDHLDRLHAALFGQALPGPEQVDGPHPLDEPVDRGERRAQQQQVRGRASRARPTTTSSASTHRERGVDATGEEREHERPDEQQRRVDREDPPEQR